MFRRYPGKKYSKAINIHFFEYNLEDSIGISLICRLM